MQVTRQNEIRRPGLGLHPKAAPGFLQKEGGCASTGPHPLGVTGTSHWPRSALLLLPGAALVMATSQVQPDVSHLPSSSAEPLSVHHSGNANGNPGTPLHDQMHLPIYLPTYLPTYLPKYHFHQMFTYGPTCS